MGKTTNMKTTTVYLYFDDDEYLNTNSKRRGYNAEFIRQAVAEAIKKEKRQEKRDGK